MRSEVPDLFVVFLMRLLDRHILKELVGPFLFGVGAFTSLMFAGKEFFKITELVAEYGASLFVAARLVLLHLPGLIVLTLPMAMLLAALLGFGRLSGDSETIALFAGGISLYRIALPVIVMASLVTGVSFVLNEEVAPRTNAEHARIFRELRNEPVSSTKPFFVIDSKDGVTNCVFYVQGGYNATTGTLRDVAMIRYVNNKPAVFIYGKKAIWKRDNEWSFVDGYWQNIGRGIGDGPTVMMSFAESKTVEINKSPDQLVAYQRKYDELSFRELKEFIRDLQEQGVDVSEYRVRLYQKISTPLTTLVFALVGIPLGLRPQRSSSAMGLGLSIFIILAYWILYDYMTVLGRDGTVSPVAASFIPTLAGAVIGLFLIARAAK